MRSLSIISLDEVKRRDKRAYYTITNYRAEIINETKLTGRKPQTERTDEERFWEDITITRENFAGCNKTEICCGQKKTYVTLRTCGKTVNRLTV